MSVAGSRSLEAELARAVPGLRVSADPADRVAYSRDLWPRHHLAVRAGNVAEHRPGLVVWPATTKEVSSVVRWAASTGTPLVPFGAGSGVCAGVLPRADVVVVDLKRMARWRTLDADAPSLDVEAGQMGMPLEEELQRRGFTLGHFPSSILCSTVGGWVAARSAGQCSGYYGKIEDMVLELECVTGTGEVLTLKNRSAGPNLIPLVVGSEGTLAVITSATLRLHPAPTSRGFAAWSLPSTEEGWEAMRAVFQAGLRPAVARLYDPFDAMLARMGAVKRPPREGQERQGPHAPGLGAAALRRVLRHPAQMNEVIEAMGGRVLGGALLLMIFEGQGEAPARAAESARAILLARRGTYVGEGPARRWLQHRYAVSYRQAPMFASGVFVDTMEVAATWSSLGALYDGVRRALGEHVFVMAHFSHAYPDGCCIYFSFAGSAARQSPGAWRRGERPNAERDAGRAAGWDAACEETYDRTWRAAMDAAIASGGTLAHHHGVGRSKAPRMGAELGAGVDVVRALQRAFDPHRILNPGNLLPLPGPTPYLPRASPRPVPGLRAEGDAR